MQDPKGYLTCSECGEVDILPGMGDICPYCGHFLLQSEQETVGRRSLATVNSKSTNRPTTETFRIQIHPLMVAFVMAITPFVIPVLFIYLYAGDESSLREDSVNPGLVLLGLFLLIALGVYNLVYFVKLLRTTVTVSDEAISINGTYINWDEILKVERRFWIPFVRDERIILVHKDGRRLSIPPDKMEGIAKIKASIASHVAQVPWR